MGTKPCLDCGLPTTASRCTTCEAARRRAEPTPAQRGYDAKHRAERKAWAPQVATGTVHCTRCDKPIPPGTPWHLDHRPWGSRPAHARCNEAAGGRSEP